MTSLRESLAITAAALQAVANAYKLDPIFIQIAGHKVAIGAILDDANRAIGEPLTDEELSAYLDEPLAVVAGMQPAAREHIDRVVAAEMTSIAAAVINQEDESDGEA